MHLVPDAGMNGGVNLAHLEIVKIHFVAVLHGGHAMLDAMVHDRLPEPSVLTQPP